MGGVPYTVDEVRHWVHIMRRADPIGFGLALDYLEFMLSEYDKLAKDPALDFSVEAMGKAPEVDETGYAQGGSGAVGDE